MFFNAENNSIEVQARYIDLDHPSANSFVPVVLTVVRVLFPSGHFSHFYDFEWEVTAILVVHFSKNDFDFSKIRKRIMSLMRKFRLWNDSSSLTEASENTSTGEANSLRLPSPSSFQITKGKKAADKPTSAGLSHKWCESQRQNLQAGTSTRALDVGKTERNRKYIWFWKHENKPEVYVNCSSMLPSYETTPPSFLHVLKR